MSKDLENIPKADMLMGSMRSMGYSFESAIADVIDNSISANCSVVKVLFPTNPLQKSCVGILDDGEGMDDDVLFEAMRYGSSANEEVRSETDLGRFGLGMKSASLSQCRVLTVVSIKDSQLSAYTWDYNYIRDRKEWVVKKHNDDEIKCFPYIEQLLEYSNGTLVLWRHFDVLSKSSDGQVYETLNNLKNVVAEYIALIYHRYLSLPAKSKITMYVNNHKIKAQDPFLESNPKTTTKKERTIAINDTFGIERQIRIKPFILPYSTDLSENDKKLIGGIENLRSKQGFYVYRNNRLIIWGTWFGMKPRAELTKNARIRVDIPNTLDDIWSIDIKKQSATIPKRIQNQLKNTVTDALEISVRKQTHRGRRNKVDDKIDYIWDRMEGREHNFYYQINRESKLYRFVKDKLSEEDFSYFEMFIGEIEKNIPIQQMYIDKSNESIEIEEADNRLDDVYQLGVTLVENIRKISDKDVCEIVEDLMRSEPFCNYSEIKEKLLKDYENGIE